MTALSQVARFCGDQPRLLAAVFGHRCGSFHQGCALFEDHPPYIAGHPGMERVMGAPG
jgi:hypothetical protein